MTMVPSEGEDELGVATSQAAPAMLFIALRDIYTHQRTFGDGAYFLWR